MSPLNRIFIKIETYRGFTVFVFHIQKQKKAKVSANELQVRLQWDPDHTPKAGKCDRRAIQLGLKGEVSIKQ